jgi:FtsZ-binding cell division protein ZapB
MNEKKVGGRKVAGALVFCVILATGMVSTIAFYSSILNNKENTINSLNSEITDKDEQISSLTSEKDDLQSQINTLNSEKDNLQSQIDGFTEQINNLTEIIELDKSEVWIDDYFENVTAGSYISLNRTVDYAGYIKFEKIGGVTTTETGEIYVQVIWSRKDLVFYNQKMVVGEDANFRFPVLPTSNLEVRVGYDDPLNGTANIIVTISYVY